MRGREKYEERGDTSRLDKERRHEKMKKIRRKETGGDI